jgi:hypothetical protein
MKVYNVTGWALVLVSNPVFAVGCSGVPTEDFGL